MPETTILEMEMNRVENCLDAFYKEHACGNEELLEYYILLVERYLSVLN